MRTVATLHSIERFLQRTELDSMKDIKKMSHQAKMYGRSKADYDGDFRNFLETHYRAKSGNTRFKVYQKKMFIFGGNKSNKLITVVNLPKKFWEDSESPIRDTRCRAN